MKRTTFATLSTLFTLASVFSVSAPVNAQSDIYLQNDSQHEIENVNQPQACTYIPMYGWFCF